MVLLPVPSTSVSVQRAGSSSMDILITVPKTVDWRVYEQELAIAAEGGTVSFKVANFPKCEAGDRCYVVHDGLVKGWMSISALRHNDFKCEVTSQHWLGKFVERSGAFHKVEPVAHKGFQGFRYVHRNEFADLEAADI